MREVRFLCLAVSRREGGNCIAGIDADSGEWIRPVNALHHGALAGGEIFVAVPGTQRPRRMAPLDIVRLRIEKYVGNQGQPENWTLIPAHEGRPHSLLANSTADASIHFKIRELAKESAASGLLFGNDAKSVSHLAIQNAPLTSSLSIVQPKYLRWQRDLNFKGYPCIDGFFDIGKRNIRHVIRLTDVAWETRLLELTRKEPLIEHADLPEGTHEFETYLTISLGDLFPQTGHHYKLIAGVLVLPRQ